mmetsp:Transcript_5195/g.4771  ORF Transcript_5195/g.4771 Transcript_5195/m.4771 type:complete len:112 (-) Transcript_5195:1370-1705(-)
MLDVLYHLVIGLQVLRAPTPFQKVQCLTILQLAQLPFHVQILIGQIHIAPILLHQSHLEMLQLTFENHIFLLQVRIVVLEKLLVMLLLLLDRLSELIDLFVEDLYLVLFLL